MTDRRGRRRRLEGDGGAVAVEFALVLPFLALMTFGLIDFGNAYRQENVLEVTVASAGRTATQTSKGRMADFDALRSISSAVGGMNNTKLVKVIVWKANSTSTVPCKAIAATGLTTRGIAGVCNVYSPEQVAEPTPAGFTGSPGCTASSWDANWCPDDRVNADGRGDYFGIYVELEYTPFTKVVTAQPVKIARSAIYRLEPPYVGGAS